MKSTYSNDLPEMKFGPTIHSDITAKANDGLLTPEQLSKVILANMMQDIHQTQSCIHFDNCAFPEGLSYIESEWAMIEASENKYDNVALGAFGRLLHTVQDFYSHSNWIELHQNVEPIPVWALKKAWNRIWTFSPS